MVSTVPGQTSETVRKGFERALDEIKREDPGFRYELNNPPERSFNTWRIDIPPTDIPVEEEIVQVVAGSYRRITGREPKNVGLPPSELLARYGNDTAHLWEAGISSCIYGPTGSSDGVEYAYVDEMVLTSRVMALTALQFCG